MRILIFIAIVSTLLLSSNSPTVAAGPKDSENYSKRILGRWLGPRKFCIFRADGSWAVQRDEDSKPESDGRKWSIHGNQLTLTYPGDRGMEKGTYTIVSFTPQRFVTESNGYKETYDRSP